MKPCALPEVSAESPVPLLATDGSLVTGDVPRPAQPTCPITGGVAPPVMSSLLTCLWSEQAKCGTVSAMMVRLGNLRIPSGGVAAWSPAINVNLPTEQVWCHLMTLSAVRMGQHRGVTSAYIGRLQAEPFDGSASLGQRAPTSPLRKWRGGQAWLSARGAQARP